MVSENQCDRCERLEEDLAELRREFNRLVDEVTTMAHIVTGNPNVRIDVKDDD
jgi:hypothetical protein